MSRAFVLVERKAADPVIPMSLFKVPAIAIGLVASSRLSSRLPFVVCWNAMRGFTPMSIPRSKRRQAGHLLVEALAGGALLMLALSALVSGDVASRRLLAQSIESLELERAATERLEYLRAQPPNAPAWQEPSRGPVPGHPEWTWTITPAPVEDGEVRGALTSFRYLRATLTLETPDGRRVKREALRW